MVGCLKISWSWVLLSEVYVGKDVKRQYEGDVTLAREIGAQF